jgi:hypothetical protein
MRRDKYARALQEKIFRQKIEPKKPKPEPTVEEFEDELEESYPEYCDYCGSQLPCGCDRGT